MKHQQDLRETQVPKVKCGALRRVGSWPLSAMILGCWASTTQAQDALFRSLDSDRASQQLRGQLENLPYTVRWRDLRLLISPSIGLEWNDNIGVREVDPESDFILTPSTSFHLSHPVGAANLLTVDIGVGYSKYFDHSELDRFVISPGSSLNFNMMIGDVLVNLHDRFSYRLDPIVSGAVSGTTEFGGIDNSAGISAFLALERGSLQAGYDFVKTISSNELFDYLDRSSHQFLARGGWKVHPAVQLGVEATASPTLYDRGVFNDSVAYSAGVYADWILTEQLKVTPRVGYTVYTFSENDFGYTPDTFKAVYFGMVLEHRPSTLWSYQVSLSNQVRPGVNSNVNEVFAAEFRNTFSFIRDLPLNLSLIYEDGREAAGFILDIYTRWGVELGANYSLTSNANLSLHYGYFDKDSDLLLRDYSQNRVTLVFSYRF